MVARILSPAQRAALFDPPSDSATIERLYTLGPDDLVEVFRRRRPANRIGYAVQLGYLRHPGRAIEPGETPPAAMLTVLAAQIGCAPDAFADYAARDTTLREHRAAIERRLGLRAFERADRGMVFATASEVATSTDRCDAIVAAMVERLRGAGVVLPVPAVLERIALVARAEARRQAFARLGRELKPEQMQRLDALLRIGGTPTRSPLAWIRDWPEAPGAGNLKVIVERLDHVRALGIEAERARRIHASRYAVIAREAAIMGETRGRPLPGALLWGSVAFAVLVTAPFALWRSHAAIHPYAAAYRAARAAPADVVLVDPRDAAFLQDVVRFDDPAQRPLLLDLPKVPMATLPALCRGRVMILDRRQARALGIPAGTTQPDAGRAAPRRAWLAHAGCGTPVPLPG